LAHLEKRTISSTQKLGQKKPGTSYYKLQSMRPEKSEFISDAKRKRNMLTVDAS